MEEKRAHLGTGQKARKGKGYIGQYNARNLLLRLIDTA
jgi:hypothetical protein